MKTAQTPAAQPAHTQSPWRTRHTGTSVAAGQILATVDGLPYGVATAHGDNAEQADANAAHIVACVNAHASLTAEVAKLKAENAKIEALRVQAVTQWESFAAQFRQAEKERAQLRAALEDAITLIENIDAEARAEAQEKGRSAHVNTSSLKRFRAALALSDGGAK